MLGRQPRNYSLNPLDLGYSYAGLSTDPFQGIAANLAFRPNQVGRHFSVWSGVDGLQNQWLQVGLKQEPYDINPSQYLEVRPRGQQRQFIDLGAAIPGKRYHMGVEKGKKGWFGITPQGLRGPYNIHPYQASVVGEGLGRSSGSVSANNIVIRGRNKWHPLRKATSLQDPSWHMNVHHGGFNATQSLAPHRARPKLNLVNLLRLPH